jgi:hypothetical protein
MNKKIGCLPKVAIGIGLLVAAGFVLEVWDRFSFPDTVTISNGVAKFEIVHGIEKPKYIMYDVAKKIYRTIQDHPGVIGVEVDVKISASGVVDKYGNKVEGPLRGPTVLLGPTDLSEVRKYRDEHTYVYSDDTVDFFKKYGYELMMAYPALFPSYQ